MISTATDHGVEPTSGTPYLSDPTLPTFESTSALAAMGTNSAQLNHQISLQLADIGVGVRHLLSMASPMSESMNRVMFRRKYPIWGSLIDPIAWITISLTFSSLSVNWLDRASPAPPILYQLAYCAVDIITRIDGRTPEQGIIFS